MILVSEIMSTEIGGYTNFTLRVSFAATKFHRQFAVVWTMSIHEEYPFG